MKLWDTRLDRVFVEVSIIEQIDLHLDYLDCYRRITGVLIRNPSHQGLLVDGNGYATTCTQTVVLLRKY